MFTFSQKSLSRLETCDERLQNIMFELIQIMDISILEGHRDQARQDQLFHEGKSKLEWPNSKHNSDPSKAIDVAPYPIDWTNRERFILMAGAIKGIAHQMGYKIRWGGDWDGDNDMYDQTFNDLPHFEIL